MSKKKVVMAGGGGGGASTLVTTSSTTLEAVIKEAPAFIQTSTGYHAVVTFCAQSGNNYVVEGIAYKSGTLYTMNISNATASTVFETNWAATEIAKQSAVNTVSTNLTNLTTRVTTLETWKNKYNTLIMKIAGEA